MRPPSSVEQPAEAKMSATKASSAFALMVTVMLNSSLRCRLNNWYAMAWTSSMPSAYL